MVDAPANGNLMYLTLAFIGVFILGFVLGAYSWK